MSEEFLRVMIECSTTTPDFGLIVRESGLDPDWLASGLAESLERGLVESFDGVGPDVLFTLTPLGASRLGVRPSEDGRRWRRKGRLVGPPGPLKDRPFGRRTRLDCMAPLVPWMVDSRSPDPADMAEDRTHDEDHPPRMWLLLGMRAVWDATFPSPDPGPCPVCGGRNLGFWTYCLKCHRSGADHLFPQIRANKRKQMPRGRKLKGGV